MTIATAFSTTTTFRFTSIEPLAPLNQQLEQIARSNGCEYAVNSTSIVNAPFCGVNYHVQEVSLCSNSRIDHPEKIAHCIEQFTRFETEQLADGFFEIIN